MYPLNLRFLIKRLCPFLLCLFLILCSCIPFHFLPYYSHSIAWVFVPIFYFAIYNPKSLSAWAVFLLGLSAELLTQSPAGIVSFAYVLLYFMANFSRKYLREMSFGILWLVFASFLLITLLVESFCMLALVPYPVSLSSLLVEFWILVLIYPLLMRFCAFLDKKIREAA